MPDGLISLYFGQTLPTMKVYKEIVAQARELTSSGITEQETILWKLLCYAAKMPLRKNQEELISRAAQITLQAPDTYFSGGILPFNVFKWGSGSKLILITHGWSSKAADFSTLITALTAIENATVVAFDAPGNGSSPGELSNLILYTEALQAIYREFGNPDIVIGHSLGAMANMMSLEQADIKPELLISIAPVINLKALFNNMMEAVDVPVKIRENFFERFFERFKVPASAYDLTSYTLSAASKDHWIAYDDQDAVVNTDFLIEFLKLHPAIETTLYSGTGHEKLIRREELLQELMQRIRRIV